MSIRDEIRSKTLGSGKKAKTTVFNYNGVSVEFRQPTVRIREEILNRSKKENSENPDINRFLIWSVIYCTYVPGSKDRVFEDGDMEAMLDEPTGSFVDMFGEEIASIMNVSIDDEVKNLKETPTS